MSHLSAAPVIATKGYVDSGLASKADLGDFQSFTDFQTRAEGFATSAQGAKADGALPISGGTINGNLFINSLGDSGFNGGLRISGSRPLIHFTNSGTGQGEQAGDFTIIHNPASNLFQMGYDGAGNWPALKIDTSSNSVLLSKDPTEALGAATKRYVDGKQVALTANTAENTMILTQPAGAAAGAQPVKIQDTFLYNKGYPHAIFNSMDFNDYTAPGVYNINSNNDVGTYANAPTYGNWATLLVLNGNTQFQLAVTHNTLQENAAQWRIRNNQKNYTWSDWRVLGENPYTQSLTLDANTNLVTVKANPTAALGIATKQYVDDNISNAVGDILSTLNAINGN